MSIQKSANVRWTGSLKEGKGAISTESTALQQQPYGFNTRFEDAPGTNPEELLAAAHAGCFSMALAQEIGKAGFTVEDINTQATVKLDEGAGGFAITNILLETKAKVPQLTSQQFDGLAKAVKDACPVSKVLNADIQLEATLENV